MNKKINSSIKYYEIISNSQREHDMQSLEIAIKLIKILKTSNDFDFCNKEVHKYINSITTPKAFNIILNYLYQKSWLTNNDNFFYLYQDLSFQLLHVEKIYSQELTMHKYIEKDFKFLFPDYKFIKSEYNVRTGYADIFAKDKKSERPVIIELKDDDEDTYKQLMRYSKNYENPILISITRGLPKILHENIIYYVYSNICA